MSSKKALDKKPSNNLTTSNKSQNTVKQLIIDRISMFNDSSSSDSSTKSNQFRKLFMDRNQDENNIKAVMKNQGFMEA